MILTSFVYIFKTFYTPLIPDGRDNKKLPRTIGKQLVKLAKVYYDIQFLIYCKKNNLTPIFTRPRFAVKISSYLQDKISRQVLESEIKDKHKKKTTNTTVKREQ